MDNSPVDTIPLVPHARFELNQRRADSSYPELWRLLDQVKDPEIPVMSIWDLGVLQDIEVMPPDNIVVTITPTYSGCPALRAMEEDICTAVREAGYEGVEVVTQLAPAWTTDWLSPDTHNRLRAYGVAPPGKVACPQCGSEDTDVISEFGSTACKSLHRCLACAEAFDRFKTL